MPARLSYRSYSHNRKTLSVVQQNHILEMVLELTGFKRVDGDHSLWIDLFDETNDVVGKDVPAGMTVNDLASSRFNFRLCFLPVWLFHVSVPA